MIEGRVSQGNRGVKAAFQGVWDCNCGYFARLRLEHVTGWLEAEKEMKREDGIYTYICIGRGEVFNVRYEHHQKKANELYGSIWGTVFFSFNIPLIFIARGYSIILSDL